MAEGFIFLTYILLLFYNYSMAKVKSKWVCSECGYETAGYLGKCPECGSWGSLVEEVQFSEKLPNAAANEFINTELPNGK